MVDIPINDVTPRNRYQATAGQTVFDYDFPILDQDHIKVQETDPSDLNNPVTLTRGLHYDVTGVGAETGGTIVLKAGQYPSGATINDIYTLTRDLPYERLNDYQFSGDFESSDVNNDFDTAIMMIQQLYRLLQGTARLDDTDALTSLPIKIESTAQRMGRVIGFNAAGTGLEAGPLFTDVDLLGQYITEIDAVGDNIASVVTVAGSIANVNTVAGAIANVNAVGSNIAAVATVATNITAVNTVATNIASVNSAAANMAAIIAAPGAASAAAASATAAQTARDAARLWATQAEDVGVNDGVNPAGFSAYHWSQKAAAAAGGGLLKISSNDTTAGYLLAKLTAAATSGISLTETNDGANESLAAALNITGMTSVSTINTGDTLAIYNAAHRKITAANFMNVINGLTALTAPALNNAIPIYDTSATATLKIAPDKFFKVINLFTADTAPDGTADSVATYDNSAAGVKKVLLNDIFKVINGFTQDTTPDYKADFIASYDVSATGLKKLRLDQLTDIPGTIANLTAGVDHLIPVTAGAKKVTVWFIDGSNTDNTNGTTGDFVAQLKNSAYVTTGYKSTAMFPGVSGTTRTDGLAFMPAFGTGGVAAQTFTFKLEFILIDPATNRWMMTGSGGSTSSSVGGTSQGIITLTTALTEIRLRCVNGTGTWDAGQICYNIQ